MIISDRTLLRYVACVALAVLVVDILQLASPSLRSEFVELPALYLTPDDPLNVVLLRQCTQHSGISMAAIGLLGLMTFYGTTTAYAVREVPSDFNESINLSITIGTFMAFAVLTVPMQFLPDLNPAMLILLRSLPILIGLGISMTAMVLPKLQGIRSGQSLNNPSATSVSLGNKTGKSAIATVKPK